ncbi:hypothetical protein GOP47_0002735 [Adiantum capillus-veneris]|uniref:Phosphofructokinase domain-containing protein n=1 Tax=Adiantum capillus-veneris TaxID=13818 RepID=A0A9D4VCM7_ADICA|nr:hypothetical protein GOP47_0002735 [Adiantum capillus-veneris]
MATTKGRGKKRARSPSPLSPGPSAASGSASVCAAAASSVAAMPPCAEAVTRNGDGSSNNSCAPDPLLFKLSSTEISEVEHIGDYLPLVPIASTYRTKSGVPWPEGPPPLEEEEPCSGNSTMDVQDMHRLFVHDDDRVLLKVVHYGHPTSVGVELDDQFDWKFKPVWARRAGPRAWIYFHPATVRAAIVTCGGLCPGLNDVIRQIVFTLEVYGVHDVMGIQYGFRGFADKSLQPIPLNRKLVQGINTHGGSFLGVSRGITNVTDVVDKLAEWDINMFFVIGGNGSHAAANAIYQVCHKRGMKIVIVGVPKTIDNDILLVERTFGFDTAVEEAKRAIDAAYVEASSAFNGIGVVKLMGRQSGFIAMHATLASGQVDAVLIPEVSFEMEGKYGLLQYMRKRIEKNGCFVIVVAEGAGQTYLEKTGSTDASGNPVLSDIGKWLVGQVKDYFKKLGMPSDVKYIDPTYMIRARPCNAADHILCTVLGQNAVHGAFAGYSNITVGLVNTHYCYLPIPDVIKQTRKVDQNSNMWHRCVTATGQPDFSPPPSEPSPVKFPLSKRRASSAMQALTNTSPHP